MAKITVKALRNMPEIMKTSKDDRGFWDWTDGQEGGNFNWELGGSLMDLDLYAKRIRKMLPIDGFEIEFIEVIDYTVWKLLNELVGQPLQVSIYNLNEGGKSIGITGGVYKLDLVDIKPRVYSNYVFGWVVTLHDGRDLRIENVGTSASSL